MKKSMKVIALLSLVVLLSLNTLSFASDFGAAGAEKDVDFTLEEMLEYAIKDEYLAKAEYEVILENFDVSRPFTNIMKAEENHINALERLYEAYNLEIPQVNPDEHTVIPDSLEAIFETGVEAEIHNIDMYEKFLDEDLPEDVRLTFEALKNASENHLKAFERGLEPRGSSVNGRGSKRFPNNNRAGSFNRQGFNQQQQ